jgi:MFS superfamily sulfate permease-like transporter
MPWEGAARRVLPAWLAAYQREWLRNDVAAGVVVWSVVVPQAIAYGQIAGLPPQAGLMAAPGALIGYALLGTSRTLVVSATTATAALSAAAVGPLAGGNVATFAVLSAALAILAGAILVAGGLVGLGAIADFVSKPIMTGFLFGLGLTIMAKQLPALVGAQDGAGVLDALGDIHAATIAVGLACVLALLALKRFAPHAPAMSIVVAAAIVVSALAQLSTHGVDVVGHVPRALPDPTWPDTGQWLELLPMALGVLILSAEAVGVARALAAQDHYEVDASRDLTALGASNILAGVSSGFVQSGGASQTAAARDAGGHTQLTSLVAAGLILLTGAFLGPLFTDLPEAALAGIVIVAVSGFLDVAELRRYVHLRRSALILAAIALAGVVVLGVLSGLILTAVLSLILVLKPLSRPAVTVEDGVVIPHAPLFYANAHAVREQLLAVSGPVTLDLQHSFDLDVETLDMLTGLRAEVELRFVNVHPQAEEMLRRAGLLSRPASNDRALRT